MSLKLLDVVSIEVVTRDGERFRGKDTHVVVPAGSLRIVRPELNAAMPVRIVHRGSWNPWLFKPLRELPMPRDRRNERTWARFTRWEQDGDVTHIAHLASMSAIQVLDKLGSTAFKGVRRANTALHLCRLHFDMKTYLDAAGFPWKELT